MSKGSTVLLLLVGSMFTVLGWASIASGQGSNYYPACDPIRTTNTILGSNGANTLNGTPAADLMIAFERQ